MVCGLWGGGVLKGLGVEGDGMEGGGGRCAHDFRVFSPQLPERCSRSRALFAGIRRKGLQQAQIQANQGPDTGLSRL